MLKGTPDDRRRLTERGLAALLAWVRRMPHDLAGAARAAGYDPTYVMSWYWHGQDERCAHPLWAELAFEVGQIMAERKARSFERAEIAAEPRVRRKETVKADGAREQTVEEVLPTDRSIDRVAEWLDTSAWSKFPTRALQDQLLELALAQPLDPEPEGLVEAAVLALPEGA